MLEQRLADALCHAAVHLGFDNTGVLHDAEIVDRGESNELDHASLGINFDLGYVTAIWKGSNGRHPRLAIKWMRLTRSPRYLCSKCT